MSSKIDIPLFDCMSYASNKFILLSLCPIVLRLKIVFYLCMGYAVISILYISQQVFTLLRIKDNTIQLKNVYLNGIIELISIMLVLIDFC